MSEVEDAPPGPEGVWLEYADGTRYDDLPLLYLGRDSTGCAQFEVLTPREDAPVSAGARLWPGMTSLVMPKLDPRPESGTGGIVPPHITDQIPGHEDDQP